LADLAIAIEALGSFLTDSGNSQWSRFLTK
jgi:hypothetical protein